MNPLRPPKEMDNCEDIKTFLIQVALLAALQLFQLGFKHAECVRNVRAFLEEYRNIMRQIEEVRPLLRDPTASMEDVLALNVIPVRLGELGRELERLFKKRDVIGIMMMARVDSYHELRQVINSLP